MNISMLPTCLLVSLSATALGQNATVRGKISFKGEKPPAMPKIDVSGNQECAAIHADAQVTLRREHFVVNPDGTMRDVFVYLKTGVPKREWPISDKPAVLDQKGCAYTPHVLGVRAGQPILIRNSDPTSHNIHALPKLSEPFNFAQSQKGMEATRTFKNPEIGVQIKCDVHMWMGAWCHVMEHPFFATTSDDGAFEIKDIPPGEYELEFWQEKSDPLTIALKLGAGETRELNVDYAWDKQNKKGIASQAAAAAKPAEQAPSKP